jgi:hypothetical protein
MAKKHKDKLARGKAAQTQAQAQPGAINPLHAHLYDPTNVMWQVMGTRPRQANSLSLHTLREVARACQPIGAVILTRQNQVARFARRPHYEGDMGFEVRMKDRDQRTGPAAKKLMRAYEETILKCGVAPPEKGKRPSLDPFLRAIVRDTLNLDAMAIEIRDDAKGALFDWFAVDGATIEIAAPGYRANAGFLNANMASVVGMRGAGYGGVPHDESDEIAFVQIVNGQPYADFTDRELAYWIRNPRTDLTANGYGFSEVEGMIETVTGFLNSMTYNSRYFTHGNIPEGVLSLMGQYTSEQLENFTRYWNAMVSGVGNSHRVPVMAFKEGKGVNWTSIKNSNKDMEFHEWLDFLITIICALYQCDREEIGFGAKGAGEPGGLGNQGNNEATLVHSQSKGLIPLLNRLQSGINDDIMSRLDPSGELEFAWTGLDPDQVSTKVDTATKFMQAGIKTVNEVRAEFDLKAVPEEQFWGDIPKDPTLFQAWQMYKQADLQAQGMMNGDDGDQGGQDGGQDAQQGAPGGQQAAQGDQGAPQGAAPPSLPKVNPDGSEEPA